MRYRYVYYIIIALFFSFISCKTEKTDAIINTNSLYQITVSNSEIKQQLAIIASDSTHCFFEKIDSLKAFYNLRENKAAWTSLLNRAALHDAILNADKEGLNPEDYGFCSYKWHFGVAAHGFTILQVTPSELMIKFYDINIWQPKTKGFTKAPRFKDTVFQCKRTKESKDCLEIN